MCEQIAELGNRAKRAVRQGWSRRGWESHRLASASRRAHVDFLFGYDAEVLAPKAKASVPRDPEAIEISRHCIVVEIALHKVGELAMATGFERYGKRTKRALFLEEMEQVVPWAKLGGLIEPHYPTGSNGRPPVGLERMLRIYFLQQWFNLSDPAVEEALYDSAVMRGFVGIDLGREPVPDETTVCKFRHLLEEHQLGGQMLEAVIVLATGELKRKFPIKVSSVER
jgi:Transposase domain (DUF772)